MTETGYDPAGAVTDALKDMTADEAVKMVRELSAALGADADSFHGNIWPGNVRLDWEGKAVLGEPSDVPALKREAEQVEYLAPEFFWDNEGSAATDVYSLALLLYAGCNGGFLPFQPKGGLLTAKDRSGALRKRMKGEPITPPTGVTPELAAILKKALSYEPEERYITAAAFFSALSETDEALPVAEPEENPVGVPAAEVLPEEEPEASAEEPAEVLPEEETAEEPVEETAEEPAEETEEELPEEAAVPSEAEPSEAEDLSAVEEPSFPEYPNEGLLSEPEPSEPAPGEAETPAPAELPEPAPQPKPNPGAKGKSGKKGKGKGKKKSKKASSSKPQPATKTAAEVKPEAKPETKPETESEAKPEAKPEPKYTVRKDIEKHPSRRKRAAVPTVNRKKKASPLIPILCVLAVVVLAGAILLIHYGRIAGEDEVVSEPYTIEPDQETPAATQAPQPLEETEPEAEPEPETTPEPEETAGSPVVDGLTVEPADDYVSVTDTGVNLRTGPGTDYEIVDSLPRGTELVRTGIVNGWSQVQYEGSEYYVATNLIEVMEKPEEPETSEQTAPEAGAPNAGIGTLLVTSDVNIRSGPGQDYDKIGTAKRGATLNAIGVSDDGKWYYISTGDGEGYVNRNLVSAQDFTAITAMSGTLTVTGEANLRSGPGTGYDILGKAVAGDEFPVTGHTENNWYRLSFQGKTAYIAGNYASVQEDGQ